MIRSFADKATAKVFMGRLAGGIPAGIQQRALDKLRMLHAATGLKDLRAPPGNRLEVLKGDRAGQWSIRINDQWWICFRWENGTLKSRTITEVESR